jgi:hypothetical protein
MWAELTRMFRRKQQMTHFESKIWVNPWGMNVDWNWKLPKVNVGFVREIGVFEF